MERAVSYDSKISLRNIRSTELPHNKVLSMPGPAEQRAEINIQTQRLDLIDTIKKYLKEKCDPKGMPKDSVNLSESETRGKREISEGIKNKDWMVYSTDKSGKVVLDTKENFLSGMSEHFKSDPEATPEEVRTAEILLNEVSRSLSKILGLGVNQDQNRKCTNTLISNHATIPTLQGLRKDHKEDMEGDPKIGPKLRPLCAANRAPNAPLSNLVSQIMKAVGDDVSKVYNTEVISAEELMRFIEEANKELKIQSEQIQKPARSGTLPSIQIHNKPIVGSMDVKALYPSILKEMAGAAAVKAISKCKLEWEGIDISTLTKYVAIKKDSEKVSRAGLDKVVPFPKGTTTL